MGEQVDAWKKDVKGIWELGLPEYTGSGLELYYRILMGAGEEGGFSLLGEGNR